MICLQCRLNEALGASTTCLLCQAVERMFRTSDEEEERYEYDFEDKLRRHAD